MGRGYYRFDEFRRMPAVDINALKSPRCEGGCYFSRCAGHYRYWVYGKYGFRRVGRSEEFAALTIGEAMNKTRRTKRDKLWIDRRNEATEIVVREVVSEDAVAVINHVVDLLVQV
eukprot:5126143-Pleurochrysis_carterae.AAC.2